MAAADTLGSKAQTRRRQLPGRYSHNTPVDVSLLHNQRAHGEDRFRTAIHDANMQGQKLVTGVAVTISIEEPHLVCSGCRGREISKLIHAGNAIHRT